MGFPSQEKEPVPLFSSTASVQENIIGKGGYGEVFQGCLEDGQLVAVKRLTRGTQDDRTSDFLSELGIIVHISHPNAAKLIGFGIEGGMHLVLQLSPNGSLASLLNGTAEGLRYLHENCQRRIIHRDIKAANILLTEDFAPQICDFGLAKWLPDQWTHHTMSSFEGTFGYMAPEYLMHGIVDEKTDVYAFGVLLLELITGRRALDPLQESLVIWILQFLRGAEGNIASPKPCKRMGMQRTYSEEIFDAEEYNDTRYLKDLHRHREIAMDFSEQ
ncbi:Receptor-like cytosolic serine/threonine-protein kinase RBK2 [Acorus calamus]|uniref:Receptor-like cytosolic serine/threonine-protein kinase RBK2 n=1 Tax=Acorus calamus TaxID=4465 RepID=A0AAV9EW53_ACOCL|nr:Receptor-like cytosolic serine/threonine-protein kinase RBK2 [Acorus calamus]